MAHVFQSLGELGGYLESRDSPPMWVADPPMTLLEAVDRHHVWASQPSVRKVVDFIARNIASIPLNQFERVSDTERRRVNDGPVAQLLGRPSDAPLMTAYRFWHGVLVDRLIYDRWCALRTTQDGREWLNRIPARRFRFKTDALDRITKIEVYRKDGGRQELDPGTCIFDAGYSTRGGNGTSPMETLADLLNEASESVQYRRSVLKRGARVPQWIYRKEKWSSETARNRFREGWKSYEAGGGQEGGTPLLEDGMELRDSQAFKPVDLDLMNARRLTDIEVASAYHIAPELVGAREGNYATVDAYRQMLYGPSLGPYIDEWQQVLNAAYGDGSTYIEANLDVKLRGSFLEQAQVTSSAVGAPWLTRDEARAMRNLPPVDGGDQLVTPLNVLVGGQASPRDSGDQNLGPKALEALTKAGTPGVKAAPPDSHLEKISDVLTGFFKRQGKTVLSAIGAGEGWWDGDRWDGELAEDLLKVTHTLATLLGEAEAERLGYPATYDADRTVEFLKAVAERRAAQINETTKAQLEEQLDQDEPDTGHVFDIAADSRAAGIATIVGTFTAGFASTEAAKQIAEAEGVEPTKTWLTGTNPRPAHAAMDGETVPIDQPFSNGQDWPGSGSDADEVAGCNCSVQIDI